MLVPYSWFQILWYFYIYGFLGWCSEVAFAAVAHGKFVNRGFVNGPICSIYGFGVMSVLLVLGPLKSSLWLLFGGSVLFTSAIEYLTGWVLEKVFHTRWWDYSKRRWNLDGYICLSSSIAWGFLTILLTEYIHQPIARLVLGVSYPVLLVCVSAVSVLFLLDTYESVREALALGNALKAMTRLHSEIEELQKRLEALQEEAAGFRQEFLDETELRLSAARENARERLDTA